MWTITHPSGGTATFESLGLAEPQIHFRAMGVSTARVTALRDFDSAAAWWTHDSIVTIYRSGVPYFTGRVQECPDSASSVQESRTLALADAWQDLEEVIYREEWGIGGGTYLYPRCVLGMDSDGEPLATGEQIGEVIDYAISQGVSITKGTIDEGYQLWPSEARNTSCEAIIVGELQFHPDWLAWLDHTTAPPTFHARAKSALETVTIDIADATVESQSYAAVKRTVPRGVSIVYESASTIDGEVYRTGYLDEAGVTSGRRVIRAMLDLEGINAAIQKSRIQTRTLPTNAATMTAWMKLKYPELADIPDGAFSWSNVTRTLAATETAPAAINPRAVLLDVTTADELPRELVNGAIEDWMRVKVGQITLTYDLEIIGAPNEAQQKILSNFEGQGRTISVTATNATTKIYKGISSFTEGEGRPVGLAAAVFAAATEQQYEGNVTTIQEELPAGRWHGKKLVLVHGGTTLMPGAVIHAASVDVETGQMSLDFGPMPYLSAGDFLELQRILNRRMVTWYSASERTADTLGSTSSGSAAGDNVGGFHFPIHIVPPGGGGTSTPVASGPFLLSVATETEDEVEVLKWSVSSDSSTVRDGTNGAAIDLSSAGFDTQVTITESKHIYLEADVSGVLELSGWVLSALDASPEVEYSTSQTKLRLYIGKVTVDEGSISADQAVFDAQLVTLGFLNGAFCKVFASHPVHPTAF